MSTEAGHLLTPASIFYVYKLHRSLYTAHAVKYLCKCEDIIDESNERVGKLPSRIMKLLACMYLGRYDQGGIDKLSCVPTKIVGGFC